MKTISLPKKNLKSLAVLVGFTLVSALPVQAQRITGMVGVGGQFGEPSGLSLKFYKERGASADFLAAWDFSDYVFFDAHATFERHLGQEGTLHFFYGPGGFLELRDRSGDQDDDVSLGISGKVGLGVLFNQFEIFGHLTPRLRLTPATDGDLGGGVGLRVYF